MPQKMEVLLQLAKGLEYIHKMELIHRDIKPENVLIWVNPNTKQVLMKWADFGFSKRVNENGTFTMSGVKGTFNWLAPEILKLMDETNSAENEAQKRGTVKSDVFAEGLVFGYFLSEGVHPFGTSSYQIPMNVRTKKPAYLPSKYEKQLNKITNINVVKQIFVFIERKKIRNIIKNMLEKAPENRIASSNVVALLEEEKEGRVKEVR